MLFRSVFLRVAFISVHVCLQKKTFAIWFRWDNNQFVKAENRIETNWKENNNAHTNISTK